MGVIRKTLSISTLGIIDFRSKKEQLRRAEKAQRAARAELVGEQAARAAADQRIAAAEKRARQAELVALQHAKKAEAASGKRRDRRRAKANEAIDALEGFVTSSGDVLEEHAKDLGRRGRKAAAKATKKAEAAAEKASKEARKHGRRAKKKLDEVADDVSDFVKERR